MTDCKCPARFSGNDEEQYRAHGCPNCVCGIIEEEGDVVHDIDPNLTMDEVFEKVEQDRREGKLDFSRTENIVLSPEDFDRVVEEINNPKPPTPALIKARQRYLDLKKEQIRDEMDEHMVKTSSAKRL